MKDFPSCFGESGVQVADFSSSTSNKSAQNLVTCVYHSRFRGESCWITVTWSKNLIGQGFSVGVDNNTNKCLCKMDIKPWLFSKKKGSKSIDTDLCKISIFWDLSLAKFGSGPEPFGGFYVGIVFEKQMVLLLGDMRKEAIKRTNSIPSPSSAVFVSKREHIFGKKTFTTKAQFSDMSRIHDLMIECDTSGSSPTEPCLIIRLNSKPIMQIKRLRWKFRGNHTILIDGLPVEVFWDVHNWLFGTSNGNAVFMFTTRESADKLWTRTGRPLYDSWSDRLQDSQIQNVGFSLVLHAWRHE